MPPRKPLPVWYSFDCSRKDVVLGKRRATAKASGAAGDGIVLRWRRERRRLGLRRCPQDPPRERQAGGTLSSLCRTSPIDVRQLADYSCQGGGGGGLTRRREVRERGGLREDDRRRTRFDNVGRSSLFLAGGAGLLLAT
ncbi:hypothetical protein [Bartonella sp. MR168JLCBS]|uniref:hypothetical protein n=1 Tax=Bartonella sp. MR168JLCBS TaxID=3243556 RepID=UPI0035CFD03C